MTATLREHAHDCETESRWPAESLAAYGLAGGWRWGIPPELGGQAVTAEERLGGFIAAARGDMSAALFITQHEGAVDLLVTSANQRLRREWLPRFAAGQALTTIGYSQLTTSRQGGRPAMRARAVEGGFVLDGLMPWVTGAPYVTNVACGATLDSGDQIVVLLPMSAPGVDIVPAAPLAALNSTFTCEVRCAGVELGDELLVSGPMPHVLSERTPVRLLLVSATGIGLAWGMLDEIAAAARRPANQDFPGGWEERLRLVRSGCEALEKRLLALAGSAELEQEQIDILRLDVNDWLLRLSGVLMTTVKGGGFRRASPAQRLAAEVQFFYVWSASERIRSGVLDALLGRVPPGAPHNGHQNGQAAGSRSPTRPAALKRG